MAKRVPVVAVLAILIAVIAVGVVVLTSGGQAARPATQLPDAYTQLAQQLKGHLRPLVGALSAPKKQAPSIQVPQQQGYSCAIASTNGCSLHPCIKYVQSAGVAVDAAAVAAQTSSTSCRNAKAVPRAVPINAP